jgi:hypothetical protein
LDSASKDENYLKRIITGEETSVYGYDVETKIVITMGWKKFAETEKRTADQVERESHVDRFFLHRGCCAS